MAGSGGCGGIWDRLLINPKPNHRKTSTLQMVRIERSPLLDQVQTFLPQMAQASEKLRKEMAAAPLGRFNIEDIDESLGKVIQMDVALFEMNQSDAKEEDGSEESSEDSSEDSSESEEEEDGTSSEVTIDNIKLPHSEGGKGKIEVLVGLQHPLHDAYPGLYRYRISHGIDTQSLLRSRKNTESSVSNGIQFSAADDMILL